MFNVTSYAVNENNVEITYCTLYGGCEYVEVQAVLVHERGVLGGSHVLDGLGAHWGPVNCVIALPTSETTKSES
jgi:hypothetical protein